MEIIIKGKAKFGRTRAEQEENLRKEGMRSLSDEQLDRLRHVEKKYKDKTGSADNFFDQGKIGGKSDIKLED